MVGLISDMYDDVHMLCYMKNNAIQFELVGTIFEHVQKIGLLEFIVKYMGSIEILEKVGIDIPDEIRETAILIKLL